MQATRDWNTAFPSRWQLHCATHAGHPSSGTSNFEPIALTEPVFAVISGLGGRTWHPGSILQAAHSVTCCRNVEFCRW